MQKSEHARITRYMPWLLKVSHLSWTDYSFCYWLSALWNLIVEGMISDANKVMFCMNIHPFIAQYNFRSCGALRECAVIVHICKIFLLPFYKYTYPYMNPCNCRSRDVCKGYIVVYFCENCFVTLLWTMYVLHVIEWLMKIVVCSNVVKWMAFIITSQSRRCRRLK